MVRVSRRLAGAVLAALFFVVGAASAGAESDAVERARAKFVEGSQALDAGRPADALRALDESHQLVASPNTELLGARALVQLGRRGEALARYRRAERDAAARVLAGESKYAPTRAAAESEGAALRDKLAILRVRVTGARDGSLFVDDARVAVPADGVLELVREPGEVRIVYRSTTGVAQRQSARLGAGSELTIGLDDRAPAPLSAVRPVERAAPARTGGGFLLPAAFGATALSVAGLGSFAGFGLSARSTYRELEERCGPSACGPDDRALADQGQRDQTIANVGLVVGSLAAVAALSLFALHASRSPASD